MSDSVELAMRMVEAFNDGDVEEACAVTAPDVEFVAIAERVTGELPDGHEGLREWFRDTARMWEELDARPSDWSVEERGEWAVLSGRTRARARGTGRDLEFEWTAVGRAERGRISRFGIFLSRDDALAWIDAGST